MGWCECIGSRKRPSQATSSSQTMFAQSVADAFPPTAEFTHGDVPDAPPNSGFNSERKQAYRVKAQCTSLTESALSQHIASGNGMSGRRGRKYSNNSSQPGVMAMSHLMPPGPDPRRKYDSAPESLPLLRASTDCAPGPLKVQHQVSLATNSKSGDRSMPREYFFTDHMPIDKEDTRDSNKAQREAFGKLSSRKGFGRVSKEATTKLPTDENSLENFVMPESGHGIGLKVHTHHFMYYTLLICVIMLQGSDLVKLNTALRQIKQRQRVNADWSDSTFAWVHLL